MAKLGSLQQNRRWQVPQQKVKGWQPNPGCQVSFSSRCPRQLVPASAVGGAGCPGLPGWSSACSQLPPTGDPCPTVPQPQGCPQ